MAAKPALGLFFTDHFIEVSEISADGLRLIRFNQLPIPEGIVVNGEIKDSNVFLTVLRRLLETAKPRPIKTGEDVIVGVSDNRVFLREFSLPKLVGREIEEAIDFQVRSLLPVLPADVETDWQIIGRDADGKIEVLLAAVPKGIINSYFETVAAAGLQVVAIEPAIFANIRIIKTEQLRGKDQLLVFIGDDFSEFTYVTNGNPRFTDFLLNTEIQKKGGIVGVIHEYVNFANSKHPARKVSEIIVSGYNSQIQAVVSYLLSEKSGAVMAASRLETAVIKDHSLLHTAHGLSLKTLFTTPSPNLLPLDFRLEVINRRLNLRLRLVLIILIIFSFAGNLLLYYFFATLNLRQAELSALKAQYNQELNMEQNQELIKKSDQINNLTDKLLFLRQTTGGEENILRELAATVPDGVTLTSLVFVRDQNAMKLADSESSWTLTGTANSRGLVLLFYNRLLGQPDFINGRLYFGSLAKESAITFRIASQTKL